MTEVKVTIHLEGKYTIWKGLTFKGKIIVNNQSVCLNPTLGRNDKVKHHIKQIRINSTPQCFGLKVISIPYVDWTKITYI